MPFHMPSFLKIRILIPSALLLLAALLILNIARATTTQLEDQTATATQATSSDVTTQLQTTDSTSTQESSTSPLTVDNPASASSTPAATTSSEEAAAGQPAEAPAAPFNNPSTPTAKDVSSPPTLPDSLTVPATTLSSPGPQRTDLLSWNVFDSRQISPTLVQTDFRAKWVRYLDADGQFKLIDTTLISTPDGWCMDKAPFKACLPLRSTGTALFHNNNRFDPSQKSVITEPPMDEAIQALGVSDVAGSLERGDLGWGNTEYVLYRNAYPQLDADLIFWIHQGTAPMLKKLIRFNNPALITSEVRLDFTVSFPEPVTINSFVRGVKPRWNESTSLRTSSSISFTRGQTKRTILLRQPEAWYFNPLWGTNPREERRIVEPIDIELSPLGPNTYKQTKIVPASFFTQALAAKAPQVWTDTTTTFGEASTTVDGRVRNSPGSGNDTWDSIHDATDGTARYNDDVLAGAAMISAGTTQDRWSDIFRGYFLFDTSSLSDTDTITAAELDLYMYPAGSTDNSTFDQKINVSDANTVSTTSLSTADYSSITNITNDGSTTPYATDVDLTGVVGSAAYFSLNFNSNGIDAINKTGISEFSTLLSGDLSDTAPSWVSGAQSQVCIHWSEESGTSMDPKLIVTTFSTLPLKVRKPANQSISNSVVPIVDNDLNLGLASSTSYILDGSILVEASSSVPDLKIRFSAPSGSEVDLGYLSGAGSDQGILSNNQTSSTIDLTANTPTLVHIGGTVKTGSVGGPLELRWAQSTADSAALTVRKGSYLRADAL